MSIRWIYPKKIVSRVKLKAAAAAARGTRRGGAAAARAPAAAAAAADWGAMWLLATMNAGLPVHDPPLSVRDEAIFLLHTAAEIEHALLVQYLYAAFSLKSATDDPAHSTELKRWYGMLTTIAKEEMGHLMTVQNLLILLGAPVNFEREDLPFRSKLYPFHFRLEPVTKDSLAKYVLTEMPEDPNNELLTRKEKKDLRQRAKFVEAGTVNRVGALYVKLLILFSPRGDTAIESVRAMVAGGEIAAEFERLLDDADFLPENSPALSLQGPERVWALQGTGINILVPAVTTRAQAVAALRLIMAQGEAGHGTPEGEESHFQRFWKIFGEFPETNPKFGKKGWSATRPVPVDPNTLSLPPRPMRRGNISNDRSRKWAKLFNIRYRMLLDVLAQYLQITPINATPANSTQFTEKRAYLEGKALTEMFALSSLAPALTGLPRRAQRLPGTAGPPFELPDSLGLPGRDEERWRWHLQRHQEFDALADELLPNESPENQRVLNRLKLSDPDKDQMTRYAGIVSSGGGGSAATSFARDIRPLFRPVDIQHMQFAFDLSSYDDVKQNSQGILARLKGIGGQRMPPPPAPPWPQPQIDLFDHWIQEGHPQ